MQQARGFMEIQLRDSHKSTRPATKPSSSGNNKKHRAGRISA
jgi:hypothetical protein